MCNRCWISHTRAVTAWTTGTPRSCSSFSITSGTNHIAALKALKSKNFIGATYFSGDINDTFARYFNQAGLKCAAMEGIDVPFQEVGQLSAQQVYAHIKRIYLKHPKADAIYMLASA